MRKKGEKDEERRSSRLEMKEIGNERFDIVEIFEAERGNLIL